MRKVYLQLQLAEYCVVDVLWFQTGAKATFSTRNIIGGGERGKRKMKEVARTQKRGWLLYSSNHPFCFLNSIACSRFLFDLIFYHF